MKHLLWGIVALAVWMQQSWAQNPDDVYWASGYHPRQLFSSQVQTMNEYNGQLIVAGYIPLAGDTVCNSIASWNGSVWDNLGTGVSGIPFVYSSIVYDGRLFIGGSFTIAGGVFCRGFASWDGTGWTGYGTYLNGTIMAMCIWNGLLVVAGEFTMLPDGTPANHIAAWDGSTWTTFGTGMNDDVTSIASFDSKLVAKGPFTSAGGVPVVRLASWDGSSWAPMGYGWWSYEQDFLILFNGQLVAAGAGGPGGIYPVAVWDGSAWNPLVTNMHGYACAAAVFNSDLYIGGYFDTLDGMPAYNLARYDGATWSSPGSRTKGYVRSLRVYNGELIVGGDLWATASGQSGVGVAAWDGSSFHALEHPDGLGTTYQIMTLADWNGRLVAAGSLTWAGSRQVNRIAIKDGNDWTPLGGGLDDQVNALAVYQGDLIAGGQFDTADFETARGVARWDGFSWSPLGEDETGLRGMVWINCLADFDNELIAGGYIDSVGGVAAHNIAAWDGTAWHVLGDGLSHGVAVLGVYDGLLVAGGTASAETNKCLAAWDGLEWSALGDGPEIGAVQAMAIAEDKLFVAGTFKLPGGVICSQVAVWNGSSWSTLGDQFYHLPDGRGSLRALTSFNDKLFVSGIFDRTETVFYLPNIAVWDGSNWAPLGSGIAQALGDTDPWAYSLCPIDHVLYVGGEFTVAGRKACSNIAAWTKWETCCTLRGDLNDDGSVKISDLTFLVNYLFRGGVAPACKDHGDVNTDGSIRVSDLTYLVNYLFKGGAQPPACI